MVLRPTALGQSFTISVNYSLDYSSNAHTGSYSFSLEVYAVYKSMHVPNAMEHLGAAWNSRVPACGAPGHFGYYGGGVGPEA